MERMKAAWRGLFSSVTLQAKSLAEPEPAFGKERPMTGFFAGLSAEQKKKALAYKGPESHGDPAFFKKAATQG